MTKIMSPYSWSLSTEGWEAIHTIEEQWCILLKTTWMCETCTNILNAAVGHFKSNSKETGSLCNEWEYLDIEAVE